MKVSNNYDFSCKQKQIGRDINWKYKQLFLGTTCPVLRAICAQNFLSMKKISMEVNQVKLNKSLLNAL